MIGVVSTVLLIVAVAAAALVIQKSRIHRKRRAVLLFAAAALVLSMCGSYVVSYHILTFSTPESALFAFDLNTPELVAEGKESALAVSAESVYILRRHGSGWKLDPSFDKALGVINTDTALAYLYRFRDTQDYYVLVYNLGAEPVSVSDNRETAFQSAGQRAPQSGQAFVSHCGYVPEADGDYRLYLNGEAFSFTGHP